MTWTRRGVLKSLSRTALVLSLEDVLGLARPLLGQDAQKQSMSRPSYEAPARGVKLTSPIAGTPLGLSLWMWRKKPGST